MTAFLTVLFLVLTHEVSAQPFTILHHFTGGDDGANPNVGLVQTAEGLLLGTTWHSAELGTFFAVTPDASGYWTTGIPGTPTSNNPQGLTIAVDGNVYGVTTGLGNHYGYGTIFRADGTLASIHSFQNGVDGGHPVGSLVRGPNEYLYGTAWTGGTFGHGTIFKLALNGAFTTVHSFNGTDGTACMA
jgi:uncharacterized repeat protein (TIGR03803 family)